MNRPSSSMLFSVSWSGEYVLWYAVVVFCAMWLRRTVTCGPILVFLPNCVRPKGSQLNSLLSLLALYFTQWENMCISYNVFNTMNWCFDWKWPKNNKNIWALVIHFCYTIHVRELWMSPTVSRRWKCHYRRQGSTNATFIVWKATAQLPLIKLWNSWVNLIAENTWFSNSIYSHNRKKRNKSRLAWQFSIRPQEMIT